MHATHITHTFVCVQAYKSDNGKPVGQGPLCVMIFLFKIKKEKEATVHYVEAITRGFKERVFFKTRNTQKEFFSLNVALLFSSSWNWDQLAA